MGPARIKEDEETEGEDNQEKKWIWIEARTKNGLTTAQAYLPSGVTTLQSSQRIRQLTKTYNYNSSTHNK